MYKPDQLDLQCLQIPSPAQLCDDPASPWSVDDKGNFVQPTIISQINKDPLEPDEIIMALLDSGLLDAVCKPVIDDEVWTDPDYMAQLMMLLIILARLLGSERKMLRRLDLSRKQQSLWEFLDEPWYGKYKCRLPARPPTADELRAFRKKVTQPRVLAKMLDGFADQSLALAQQMGSLVFVPRGNVLDVYAYNLLTGDGTVNKRYSEIDEVIVDGVATVYGSKAKDPSRAKVQRRTTDNSVDDKADLYGLNIAHVGTITYAGYLVLAVSAVATSEGDVAMNLIDKILGKLAPGVVHGVVYDKAITGWHVDYLLGKYGIPVIGKATAANTKKDKVPDDVKELREHLKAAGDAAIEQQMKLRGKKQKQQLGTVERRVLAEQAAKQALARLAQDGMNEYQGTAIRYDSRGIPEIVASANAWLGFARHTTSDGGDCVHRFVVDDGALTEVVDDGVKTQRPEILHAHTTKRGTGYTVTATWKILCAHGDFEHTDRWTPPKRRGPRTDSERSRTNRQKKHNPVAGQADDRRRALQMLRLIPQHDPRWALIAGLRNLTESWHASYKRLLPNKRATSPNGNEQVLQYLAAVMSYNAERWERHSRYQRHLARKSLFA
jgi:hypothetical protein